MWRIVNVIRRPTKIILYLSGYGIFNLMPDEMYLKMTYRCRMGTKLNLSNPSTYNEKLQWLKIHDRKPEYTIFADKYAVQEYCAEKIGREYLIPLLGVYQSVEEIPWDNLPKQFVLKCTHSSGTNIICRNKNELDIEQSKRKLHKWLNANYYWRSREWPYNNIVPRIICQELISQDGNIPIDYKVMCFNGKARLIYVHLKRFGSNPTYCFYDRSWNRLEIRQGPSMLNQNIDKPTCLDEMLSLSELLARDLAHVRIDWFEVGGKLFFVEITFYHASGFDAFDNPEDDLMLGSWINLEGL